MVKPPKGKKYTNEATVAPFRRVNLADVEPLRQSDSTPDSHYTLVCLVCNQGHPPGQCRLKSAGTEHCGLCGLAHYGSQRACPHLRSEEQVTRMLDALKYSTEDHALKTQAKSYVYGIKTDLAKRRKFQKSRQLQQLRTSEKTSVNHSAFPTHFPANTGHSSSPDEIQGPPTVDLTAGNVSGPSRYPTNPSSVSLNGSNSFGYGVGH